MTLERQYLIYWAFTPGLTPRGPLPDSRLPPVGVVTVGIYERAERALSSCVSCQVISCCTPGGIGSHHGIKDKQDLMHTSSKGNFGEFTGMNQSLIECLYDRIVNGGSEGGHV